MRVSDSKKRRTEECEMYNSDSCAIRCCTECIYIHKMNEEESE